MIGPNEVWCGWCEDPFDPVDVKGVTEEESFCSYECYNSAQDQADRELELKAQGPRYRGKFSV